MFDEESLSWVSWDVEGFNGLEIWNFMSEYKAHLTSWPEAIYYAFRPDLIPTRPPAEVLGRWDRLLKSGQKVVAIGGADAHAWPVSKGPLRRVVFPYAYLFGSINTHVLIPAAPTGDMELDRKMIFDSLRGGRAFVANDRLAPIVWLSIYRPVATRTAPDGRLRLRRLRRHPPGSASPPGVRPPDPVRARNSEHGKPPPMQWPPFPSPVPTA